MSAVSALFNLYPGEARRSRLFLILGLLWSFGAYGMFTLSEGTFLEYVGVDHLPQAYIVISISLCALSSLLIFLLKKISIRHLLGGMIATWSAVLFTFYFLHVATPLSGFPAFWFAFRVMGWIIPITSYICFWAFVDQYFDLQDGKRVFSLFNSFLLLGDFLAAGVISYAVEHIGVSPLIFLFGTCLVSSLPLIFMVVKKTKPVLDEHLDHLDSSTGSSIKHTLKILITSKFTIVLLLFYLVMQTVNLVTEFNYMNGFEIAFAGQKTNELTAFIGKCSMWISFCNMLVSSLIYGRLVKRVGINNIILLGPVVLLSLFSCWTWKTGLGIAVFGMFAREGMSYVMDDNNLNLLLTGVPTKIKNQMRITVESFFEPAGMLVSAVLLFCCQGHSVLLGLVMACTALVVALFLRYHYPRAIFLNLVAHSIRFGKKAVDWINKGEHREVEFRLLSHLKGSHEKSQLLAFEYLLILEEPRVLPQLLNQMSHFTLPGKIEAIELLSDSVHAKETVVVEKLERLRRLLPYPQLRSAIHFYFARHGLFRPEKICHDLESPDLKLRSAAILTLKTSPFAEHLPSYRSIANQKFQELLEGNEEELRAALCIIGYEGRSESIELLFPYLKHESHKVRRQAADAISRIAHPDYKQYGVKLASRLCYTHDAKTRAFLIEAIEYYENPDSIIPLIGSAIYFKPCEAKRVESFALAHGRHMDYQFLALLKEEGKHEHCRLIAGKVLAKLNPQLLRAHLNEILQKEMKRAYHNFFHSKTIQKQLPGRDLSPLEGALLTGYHNVVDFIIQLVGAANEISDCEVLTMSLWSPNKKIRAQAIESLEKTAPPRLFQQLLPLINEDEEVKIRTFLRTGTPLSLHQLLDQMEKSPSPTYRIVSAGFKVKLDINWDWERQKKEFLEHLVIP